MKLARVTKKEKNYKLIKQLYKQSFPPEERVPFWLLMRRANTSTADFWSLYDHDNWVGMAYVVKGDNLAYIFYLAVTARQRQKGYGSKAMKALKARYQNCKLFLALETLDPAAENYEQRLKRHEFYKKCGLSDIPYYIKEASVIYAVMGIGGKPEPAEFSKLMNAYLGKFFSRLIDTRIIKKKCKTINRGGRL